MSENQISYDRIDEWEKENEPTRAEFKAFLEADYDEESVKALLSEYGY